MRKIRVPVRQIERLWVISAVPRGGGALGLALGTEFYEVTSSKIKVWTYWSFFSKFKIIFQTEKMLNRCLDFSLLFHDFALSKTWKGGLTTFWDIKNRKHKNTSLHRSTLFSCIPVLVLYNYYDIRNLGCVSEGWGGALSTELAPSELRTRYGCVSNY